MLTITCWPGTNPSALPAPARRSASITARRAPAYLHTYEYDTATPCSPASRCQIRREVCHCDNRQSGDRPGEPHIQPLAHLLILPPALAA